jgi:hypothetical protein
MIAPHTLVVHLMGETATNLLFALALLAGVACLTLAVLVEAKDQQERKREIPPVPEAPTVPREFRPRKHKAVKDRLAWRKVHPREADAIARHARQLHFHDAEVAELREASR